MAEPSAVQRGQPARPPWKVMRVGWVTGRARIRSTTSRARASSWRAYSAQSSGKLAWKKGSPTQLGAYGQICAPCLAMYPRMASAPSRSCRNSMNRPPSA